MCSSLELEQHQAGEWINKRPHTQVPRHARLGYCTYAQVTALLVLAHGIRQNSGQNGTCTWEWTLPERLPTGVPNARYLAADGLPW